MKFKLFSLGLLAIAFFLPTESYSQVNRDIGLLGKGSYLIREVNNLDPDFRNDLGWGAQVHFSVYHNNLDNILWTFNFAYIGNSIQQMIEPLDGSASYLYSSQREYLIYSVMIGWEPFDLRHDRIVASFGPSWATFLQGTVTSRGREFDVDSEPQFDAFIPGAQIHLAYDKRLGRKSSLFFRLSAEYTQFFGTNTFSRFSSLNSGLIWRLPKSKGNGLFR